MSATAPATFGEKPPPGGRSPAIELERRWRAGQQPDLAQFLEAHKSASSLDLVAAIRVDQRQRWSCGQRLPAESYLKRFGHLLALADQAVDVVYSEYLLREALGEPAEFAEFAARFPEYATTLRDQIDLHRALARTDDTVQTDATRGESSHLPGAQAPPRTTYPSVGPDYEIVRELGSGGMGVVYQARQRGLNRLVALKVMRYGDFSTPQEFARFRSEAEAVARLHHPHIVQIYDYGEHEGLPFLALELVEGGTLAKRLDGRPWPARRAAELLLTLARAVQFAHERGVIHRDLKPANVLISQDAPKIADFGLAKVFRDESAMETCSGAILGTPSYMAPEQAGGKNSELPPAADIYALGAILYELLTGRPPYCGETPLDTLHQLLTGEPVSIHRLVPRLPADLATICNKCLEREPARRYASAEELADDLARFLADEPIRARPISSLARGWRWCRRNRPLALALASVAALLVTIAAGSTWYSGRLSTQLKQTQQAQAAEHEASQSAELRLWDSYLAEITARSASRQVGQRFAALETVDQAAALLDKIGRSPERVLKLRNAALGALALPDLRRTKVWRGWPEEPAAAELSIALDRYIVSTASGNLLLYQLSTGRQIAHFDYQGASVVPALAPGGRFVAACGSEGTKVWRMEGDTPVAAWELRGGKHFAFAPDGQLAAISDDQQGMHLVKVENGEFVRALGNGPARSVFRFHAPTGRVAVCGGKSMQIIAANTGRIVSELPAPLLAYCHAWHPSGDFLALWGHNEGVVLWNIHTRAQSMVYPHRGMPAQIVFNRDGSQFFSFSIWDGHLRLWDVGTAQKLLEMQSFSYCVGDVAADGNPVLLHSLATAGEAELWQLAPGAECRPLAQGLHPPLGPCYSASISNDNRLLALGRNEGWELWDLDSLQRVAHWSGGACSTAFDSDDNLLTACEFGIYRWPRRAEATRSSLSSSSHPVAAFSLGPPERLTGPMNVTSFAASLDGRMLVFEQNDGFKAMRLDSPGTKINLPARPDPRKATISSDHRLIALANWNALGTSVWDAASGEAICELQTGMCGAVQFSPDGRWLATSPDGVRLWRVADWQLDRELHLKSTTPNGMGMTFSPDSRVLLIGDPGGVLRLLDPTSGELYAQLLHPDSSSGSHLVFSPDQSRLATLSADERFPALVWNIDVLRQELSRRGLDWPSDVLAGPPSERPVAETPLLQFTVDDGGLKKKQQSANLLRKAGKAKTPATRDRMQQAIALDPENALAHNQLAWLVSTGPPEVRDPPTAVEHARRAVAIEPDNGSYQNTLGVALYRAGQYDEAIAAFHRSLELGKNDSAVYDHIFLALCYAALGQWDQANDFHDRATSWFADHQGKLLRPMHDELMQFLAECEAIGLQGTSLRP